MSSAALTQRIAPFYARVRRVLKRKLGVFHQRMAIRSQFQTLGKAPQRFALRWSDRHLCMNDATAVTNYDHHYVLHTGWACRVLAETTPSEHVDISSSLYFVALASAFVPIKFYDYRPAQLNLSNLTSEHADLTKLQFADGSISSLSSMHVVEHVGLGRYGDPLDYDGDLKAVAELKRVLAVGGQLLFVVPIGGEARIQFNAHRIYTYRQVLGMFKELELIEFSLVPDDRTGLGLVRNASESLSNEQRYGCGCFLFRKAN